MIDSFLREGVRRYGAAKTLLDSFSSDLGAAIEKVVRGHRWKHVDLASHQPRSGERNWRGAGPARYLQFAIINASAEDQFLEVGIWWEAAKDDRPWVYAGIGGRRFDQVASELLPHDDGNQTWLYADPALEGFDVAVPLERLLIAIDGYLEEGSAQHRVG